ncbi:MAG: hypothetical protein R2704_08815 [Microthrixaceae bacterium]
MPDGNRRRLLDAAIGLILELGGEPPGDAIAQRAGVGIGTLYRSGISFDRQALLHAVVADVLDRTIERRELALAEVGWRRAGAAQLHAPLVDVGLGWS